MLHSYFTEAFIITGTFYTTQGCTNTQRFSLLEFVGDQFDAVSLVSDC